MRRTRRLWLATHRYLAFALGAVLVVVGLTGSILAFYEEIDAWINPDWVSSQPTERPISLNQVIEAARRVHPNRFLHSLFPPDSPHGVWHVWFTPESDSNSAMWQVLVDPWKGRVLGAREAVPTMEFSGRNITNTLYTLHMQLFLGEAGATIVGFSGLALLVSGCSGLYLWWPRTAGWRKALWFKRGTSGARFNYDLHRYCGVYSVAVLLVVAFTGVCMSFPKQAASVVSLLSPVRTLPSPQTDHSSHHANPDALLAAAQRALPAARLSVVWLPETTNGSYRFTFLEPGHVGAYGGRSEVWVDPRDAKLLAVRRYEDTSSGEAFLRWQLPLHNGKAFGLAGRILVCLAGLIPLVLFVTGLRIWYNKRRVKSLVNRSVSVS